ncbi:MAG: thioredoxin family protein [Acidobacteria bacterium]|nr:thioredoxin family protein [Acidobacteriota bacterium]
MRNTLKIVLLLSLAALLAAPAGARPSEAADVEKEIGFGETVKIEDHLVKGKTVIVDFFSQYCPPCRRISPLLTRLAEKRSDLFVLKVNINRKDVRGIDWGSPVARQFKLESVPHFIIYGADGKVLAEGEAAFEKIERWLQEAGIR